MNKLILGLFTIALLLNSCSAPVAEESGVLPEDLELLKALRIEKRQKARDIQKEIEAIDEKIVELDPKSVRKKTLITATELSTSTLDHYFTVQGTVQAKDQVAASSEIGGRIIKLYVAEGDAVRKGQLIAKIDLESLDKQIAEINKSLELAKDIFDRQSRLWDQKIGSEIQFLQAKNNKERLEKSIESLQFQKSKSEVTAPISGVVEMVFAKSGELAGPGSPIVIILDTRSLEAVVDVPENYLKVVKKGQKITMTYPSLEMEVDGRINDIGRVIDPSNRTFSVQSNVSSKNGQVKPNMLVEMKLKDFSKEDVIVVPLPIIQEEVGGKQFIFTAQEGADGKIAKKTYIQIGEVSDGKAEITSGLKAGDIIVLEGALILTENELIEIKETEVKKDADVE